jgi:(2S)-methylsuccinyl-CoA dehydrogenase
VTSTTSTGVDLYWIPLGAGGRVVRLSGKLFEELSALVHHRAPRDLYHAALEDWWVPAANLVGEQEGLGRGFYFQMEGFENGRLQTAARALGVMQAAYEAALEYANDRTVFGSSVFDYQITRAKLGRMAVLIQACRQFAYQVARMMARGEGGMEASLVKAYVCRAAEWVTREAMQIHGGMGYAEEFAVSRLFVDARVLSIFEGTDEVLCLRVIARRLSGR